MRLKSTHNTVPEVIVAMAVNQVNMTMYLHKTKVADFDVE